MLSSSNKWNNEILLVKKKVYVIWPALTPPDKNYLLTPLTNYSLPNGMTGFSFRARKNLFRRGVKKNAAEMETFFGK